MSILEPRANEAPRAGSRRATWLLRGLSLCASIVAIASLWLSERARVRDDLQLAAEAVARPGDTLALRAFYLRDVEAAEGPTLERVPTDVHLLDAQLREIARTTLRFAWGDPSMEGRLSLPTVLGGTAWLEARAHPSGQAPLVCRRELSVFAHAPRRLAQFRAAPPLQQLSVGALRSAQLDASGLLLEPLVAGGACVPEQRCTLWLWVGEPSLSVRLRHDRAVTVHETPPHQTTSELFAFELTVHGPEATIAVEAWRGGERLADRTVRLPIGLGEPSLSLAHSLLAEHESARLEVQLPPGRNTGIVDVFADGHWSATRAFHTQRSTGKLEVPAGWLRGGINRLQAHTDRFAGESAASRLVYVHAPGESAHEALTRIAALVNQAGFGTRLTRAWARSLPASALANPQASAALLLAALEAGRSPLPTAVSGRPRALGRLTRLQTGMRYGVAGVLALSALLVGGTLLLRGLSAQREADAILEPGFDEEGGEQSAPRKATRLGNVLLVVSLVLVVCVGFLAAALLVLAKPLWF